MKIIGNIRRGDMVILYYKSGNVIIGEYYNGDEYIISIIRNTILTGKGEQLLRDVYEQTEVITVEDVRIIKKLDDDLDLKELYYARKWL